MKKGLHKILLINCLLIVCTITKAQVNYDISIAFAHDSLKLIDYDDTIVSRKGDNLYGEVKFRSHNYITVVTIDSGFIKKKMTYYPNGKKCEEYNYLLGKLHGPYFLWRGNGDFIEKGYYKNGLEDSVWTYYYDNGKIESEGAYLPDSSVLIEDFKINRCSWKPTQNILERQAKHSPPDGEWKFYDDKGDVSKKMKFRKGVLVEITVGEHFGY